MGALGDRIADLLADGVSVDVVGLPLSGRSTVLAVAADRAREHGLQVLRTAGVRAWRDRPLAALALLDLGAAPGPASPADVVRRLVAATGSRPGLVVVDDADDLDAASAGALAAVHRATGVPLLTARRAGSDGPEGSAGVRELLGGVHPAAAFETAPWPFDEVHRLVHDLLGGPVDPAAVASVAVLAGGLPGLAAALVTAARSEGVLVASSGLWTSTGAVSATGLARALAPLVRALEPADLDGLTVLALAARPSVAAAGRLVGDAVLSRLERLGLATTTTESGGAVAGVVPPALGELLVAQCGPLRRDGIERRVAEHLDHRLAPLGADRVPALGAAVTTKRITDHWEAERRVLLREWRERPLPATAAALLVATAVCGPVTPTPEEIHAGTDRGTAPSADVVRLECGYAWYLAAHRRSTDDAVAHLEACARAYPEHAAAVAATRAHLDAVFGPLPGPGDLDALVAGSTGAARATAETVRVEAALFAGRSRTALSLLAAAPAPPGPARATRDAAAGLALLLDGDVAGGIDRALAGVAAARAALDPGRMQAHAYVAALGLGLAGRFSEVDTLVAASLTMTTRTPQEEHYRAGVLALAAIAAGWQGRWGYARRLTLQARALDHRTGPLPGMLPGQLLAIANARGLTEAADELWAVAEERLAHGYVTTGVVTAVAAIERRATPERGARLRAALAEAESPLLVALGRYAGALVDGDHGGLDAAQEALSAIGVHTYAVRAVVAGAVVRREGGDVAGALDAVARAWELTSRLDGTQVAFFHPYVRALELSARELEVVDMIGTGLTGTEVAAALSISLRTVESHLLAAYRKAGVDNRDDLGLAVTTWLAPPSR